MSSYRIIDGTISTITDERGSVVKLTCQTVFTNDKGQNSTQQYYEVDGSDEAFLNAQLQATAEGFSLQPEIIESAPVIAEVETALSERIVSESVISSERILEA